MTPPLRINLRLIPSPLSFHLDDLMAHDAGAEDSSTAEMVRAYLEDRLTHVHIPALLEEAAVCLHVLDGAGNAPPQQAERRKLTRFIGHLRTLDPLA
jgi:hypothetical protein